MGELCSVCCEYLGENKHYHNETAQYHLCAFFYVSHSLLFINSDLFHCLTNQYRNSELTYGPCPHHYGLIHQIELSQCQAITHPGEGHPVKTVWQEPYGFIWGPVSEVQIHGLVQERRNSIANALESRFSCTNPSKQERLNSIANALELRLSCTNPLKCGTLHIT